ncbi:MAG: DUF1552 domain-containing protein [Acidimicrobiia bacterium]|nr:DUF1552 domain-containing protein [Acidimicrobiia bacterium]
MTIVGKSLPRRTVLRGIGTTLALPLLDCMVPAFAATPKPIRRFGEVYVSMGFNMPHWTPPTEGPLEITRLLRPLESFKDRLLVLSGLDSRPAEGRDGGVHPRTQTAWNTGVSAFPTEGPNTRAGTSLDQHIANEIGGETQLPSLELALEPAGLSGNCAFGYSCTYLNTLAWKTPTTPLPMEMNPRAVFERLFGASDSTDPSVRLRDIKSDRSVLDSVVDKIARLQKGIAPSDRAKVSQYLQSVRDVERRIQLAEEQVARELPEVERPAGVPATYEEHAKLMFDLLVLAYQTDLTRVATYLEARELSARTYPEIGCPDPHHPASHHGNNPEKLERLALLNTFHIGLFGYFLQKMQETPDGDGSLLDHTLLLFGSGMSDGNIHLMYDVPTVVVANKGFDIQTGRHMRAPKETPLTNLQLTLMEKMGLQMEKFGNSNGELTMISIG